MDEDEKEWNRWSTGEQDGYAEEEAPPPAEGAKPAELLEEMLDGVGGLSMMSETSNQLLQIAQRQVRLRRPVRPRRSGHCVEPPL